MKRFTSFVPPVVPQPQISRARDEGIDEANVDESISAASARTEPAICLCSPLRIPSETTQFFLTVELFIATTSSLVEKRS